ncbi:VCBS repeat-containing protein [candidate division KSB1 bacterium]|nr:VCBS repeat-containing protein [candidate division KSB1 bacterium]
MKKYMIVLLLAVILFSIRNCFHQPKTFTLDKWTYIQVDSSRTKWGDYEEPDWLRYFGLDMKDINGDNYQDILAGRYIYRNSTDETLRNWVRIDLGKNVDGMLFVDVDRDEFSDIIAEALPAVYWLEAQDVQGNTWKAVKIGEIPRTDHINGQGFKTAQVIAGGKEEILLAAKDGIYCLAIPQNPENEAWQIGCIAETASDEGIGTGDIDGDHDIDIAAGDFPENGEEPVKLVWWENPGDVSGLWETHLAGITEHAVDRVEIADINGDAKPDIIITEERWPGEEPDSHLFWFEAPRNPKSGDWIRHLVVQQYSMNNLDVDDMDRDGDSDIVTNEHKGLTYKLQIWENDGKGNFTEHLIDTGKESHLGTQLSDLDGDGDTDIISAAWDHYKYLHVWRNDAVVKK